MNHKSTVQGFFQIVEDRCKRTFNLKTLRYNTEISLKTLSMSSSINLFNNIKHDWTRIICPCKVDTSGTILLYYYIIIFPYNHTLHMFPKSP